jgi:hypothetical protein
LEFPEASNWYSKWHIDFKEYQEAITKSQAECEDLKAMNKLLLILAQTHVAFLKSTFFFDEKRFAKERYSQSLVYTSFLELFRNLHNTVFLSACGLYKNAYHNIRYALEFIIQSYYIDTELPNGNFNDRTRRLSEIENKPKYRGTPLLNKLNIPSVLKEEIANEYTKLHKRVHSTSKQFVYTAYHFMDNHYTALYLDIIEVSKIYNSSVKMMDFFYYLLLNQFPELKKELIKNKDFLEVITDYDLPLMHKQLWK